MYVMADHETVPESSDEVRNSIAIGRSAFADHAPGPYVARGLIWELARFLESEELLATPPHNHAT